MSVYRAINVDLNTAVEFRYSDHMGAQMVRDKKTARMRARTIRDGAEDVAPSHVHGWSAEARPGAVCRWMSWKEWKALLATDPAAARQAIQTVLEHVGTTKISIPVRS